MLNLLHQFYSATCSYGLGVFSGTALLIASAYEALPDKDEIPNTFVFTQTSVALNGWSFGGIWVAEGQLSDPVVQCGAKDFQQAMDTFA